MRSTKALLVSPYLEQALVMSLPLLLTAFLAGKEAVSEDLQCKCLLTYLFGESVLLPLLLLL